MSLWREVGGVRVSVFGGLVVLVTQALIGCGESSSGDAAGTSGNASGGQSGAEQGGAGAAHAAASSAGAPTLPAAGECRVTRRLEATFATGPSLQSTQPTRLQNGFIYQGQASNLSSLAATLDNGWRELKTSVAFFPQLAVAAGSAEAPQVVLFQVDTVGQEDEQLLAQTLRGDGSTVAPLAPVLSIFHRGSATYPTTTALDGERIAVGNGHIATRDPHFILLDKDAQPIAGEVVLFDSGNRPLFACFELTGTAHGVLASVLDLDTLELHLIELDANGARVNEVTAPVAERNCPWISVDTTGNYFSFKAGLGSNNGPGSVFRFADNALTQVATLPSSADQTSIVWVAGGDAPLLAVNDYSAGGRHVSFARLIGGSLRPFRGDTFTGELVPSADGRIFLASTEPVAADANAPDQVPELRFTIVEVSCDAASD